MSKQQSRSLRRWGLVAVGVAVVLYGIVGFPTPNGAGYGMPNK